MAPNQSVSAKKKTLIGREKCFALVCRCRWFCKERILTQLIIRKCSMTCQTQSLVETVFLPELRNENRTSLKVNDTLHKNLSAFEQ